MTKYILFFTLLLSGMGLRAQSEIPSDWKLTQLYDYRYGFQIKVPPGATIEEGYFGLEIRNGEKFGLRIIMDDDPRQKVLSKYRAETENNRSWKLDEFIHEEENGFIAKQKLASNTGYNFYYVGTFQYKVSTNNTLSAAEVLSGGAKVWDNRTFLFTPVTAGDYTYTEEDIRLMYTCAKSAIGPDAPKKEKPKTPEELTHMVSYEGPEGGKNAVYDFSILTRKKNGARLDEYNYHNQYSSTSTGTKRALFTYAVISGKDLLILDDKIEDVDFFVASLSVAEFAASYKKDSKKHKGSPLEFFIDSYVEQLKLIGQGGEVPAETKLNFTQNALPFFKSLPRLKLGARSEETYDGQKYICIPYTSSKSDREIMVSKALFAEREGKIYVIEFYTDRDYGNPAELDKDKEQLIVNRVAERFMGKLTWK